MIFEKIYNDFVVLHLISINCSHPFSDIIAENIMVIDIQRLVKHYYLQS